MTKNRGRTSLSGRLDDLSLIYTKNSKDREEEEVKLEFNMDFLPHQLQLLTNQDLKIRVLSWNLSYRHSRYKFTTLF